MSDASVSALTGSEVIERELWEAAQSAKQALDYGDQDWVSGLFVKGAKEIERLRVDLADSQANALSEAQAGENSQDEVIRLRKALMEIWRYPKGWENRGSIQDFIAEVVPPDARP